MASSTKSISKPVAFRANVSGLLYFNSKDLQEFDPFFYHGCKTKPRNILAKKNIPSSEYMYANFNTRNGSWITSTEECKKAQLLITKTWVEAHMRSMQEERRNEPDQSIPPIVLETPCDKAHPIIFIEESRKFRDETGTTVDIDVRGILACDMSQSSVFFRCSDVAFACEMLDLSKVITQSDNVYREKIDYVYFQLDKRNVVELYLTREGVVKVFSDKDDENCRRLMQWVIEVSCLKNSVEKEIKEEESQQIDVSIVGGGGEERVVKEEYEAAPDPLYLEEHEKLFVDQEDGTTIEVVALGTERKEDQVYFLCSNVSKAFGMLNLNKSITREDRGGYTENIDYMYFNPYCSPNGGAPPNKNANKYSLYLTYEGLLRVLFISRHKDATKFRKWATSILFTHQMGTKESKEGLAAKLAGIDLKSFKAVFNKYATTFPSIYLMHLGQVKDLRQTFGIDSSVVDDLVVYKYGFTGDLVDRFKQHMNDYGKLPGVTLLLTTFHMIDPQYTSKAESDVRQLIKFQHLNLTISGRKELVAMSEEDVAYIKKEYGNIGLRYAGATAELRAEIRELEKKLEKEIADKELQKERYENELEKERADKDLQKERYEKDLQKEMYERRLVELDKRLVEMERDNYKRERDDYKVTIDRLNR